MCAFSYAWSLQHRLSQDFVWVHFFLKESWRLFLHVALKSRSKTTKSTTPNLQNVLKIDSCSIWGCIWCAGGCTQTLARALCFIEAELIPIEVFYCWNTNFFTFFALVTLTLTRWPSHSVYELDSYRVAQKMHHYCMYVIKYTVFQKSDAKIQITITTSHLIRINYPLSSFNYRLSDTNVANFNKIHLMVSEQQLFKNGT